MHNNPDISGFASGIGSELNRLTHPEAIYHQPNTGMRHSAPTRGVGGLQFVEQPTANSAGSDIVGMEVPNPTMIPIPDDMREMVAEQLRAENPRSAPPARPPLESPDVSITETTEHVQYIPETQTVPVGFDFDLFQFAIMKDSFNTINHAIKEINSCIGILEKHKSTLESAMKSSSLNRTQK